MKRKHFSILSMAVICCLSYAACEKSKETPVDTKNEVVAKSDPETNINNTLILNLVNKLRIDGCDCKEVNGTKTKMPSVGVLTWNQDLAKIAKAHSDDMEAKGYFAHISADGKTHGIRMTNGGYLWSASGENIAKGQRTEREVFTSWLNSKDGHCKAMMNPNVEEMGVARSNGTTYYWTQLFGTKK